MAGTAANKHYTDQPRIDVTYISFKDRLSVNTLSQLEIDSYLIHPIDARTYWENRMKKTDVWTKYKSSKISQSNFTHKWIKSVSALALDKCKVSALGGRGRSTYSLVVQLNRLFGECDR
jgi:hypothetical protein